MTAVLFTSDLHLGHRKVAELRGFESVEDHDDALSDAWISSVGEGDIVFVLGDLAASNPTRALERLSLLPGRKRLILGNHDKAHPMYRDAWKWQRDYLSVFEGIAQSARIRVEGREVVLSHFPYERDRHEARYLQWRLRDEGLPLLHGHTHGTERLTLTARGPVRIGMPLPRVEVHVGVDAWGLRPVTASEISSLLP